MSAPSYRGSIPKYASLPWAAFGFMAVRALVVDRLVRVLVDDEEDDDSLLVGVAFVGTSLLFLLPLFLFCNSGNLARITAVISIRLPQVDA